MFTRKKFLEKSFHIKNVSKRKIRKKFLNNFGNFFIFEKKSVEIRFIFEKKIENNFEMNFFNLFILQKKVG